MRAVPNTTFDEHQRKAEGTWNETREPTNCGFPPDNSYHLFRSADDPNYPWTGVVFGATISGIWYWCTDQVIVQRALAAKNMSHAKSGTILAGYLKFLPMWIIVFPGMISRILFTDEIMCVEPDICEAVCSQASGCTNIAYTTIVLELMPTGARGLMMAVMLAALLSSLTSIFNSSSTLWTMDCWILIRPKATDAELMICGRVFVLFMVAVGICWIPIVQNFSELFDYIQSVTSYLSPPICAVYLMSVFWKGTTEQGAFWSLIVGLFVGCARFGWESAYGSPACEEDDDRPTLLKEVHYLHFGCILFSIVFIWCWFHSLLTKPMPEEYLHQLLFWSRNSEEKRASIDEKEAEEKRLKEEAKRQKALEEGGTLEHAYELDNGDIDIEQVSTVSQPVESEKQKKTWYKAAWDWTCGVEDHPEMDITEEERLEMERKACSLYEEPFWRRFVNVNALTLLVCTTFYWGFFY